MIDPIVSEQLTLLTTIIKVLKEKTQELERRVDILESKEHLTDCISNVTISL